MFQKRFNELLWVVEPPDGDRLNQTTRAFVNFFWLTEDQGVSRDEALDRAFAADRL